MTILTPNDAKGPVQLDPYAGAAPGTQKGPLIPDTTAPPLPTITGDDDFAALKPGTAFRGPDNKVHTKLWTVDSDEDFDIVPEGAQFIGPDKKTYRKRVSDGIGYTAEMLYQMALTDDAREQALKKIYGDKVKRDTVGNFFVEDGDVIRRPGARGVASDLGYLTAEAAPSAGLVIGGLLGAGGGEVVEPLGGGIPGGFAGAMGGAMVGRQVNNVVLGLAGIHQDMRDQLGSMAWEGAGVAVGEGAGKALFAIPRAVGALSRTGSAVADKVGGLKQNLSGALEAVGITPDRARGFLGTSRNAAEKAAQITEQGGRVPPSVLAPEAPFLKKIEEFDAVFRAQNVFGQANEKYYNNQVKKILEDKALGVRLEEESTRATKKVSSERAGQMALEAARHDMAHADGELENAVRGMRETARRPIEQAGGEQKVVELRQAAMDRLKAAHERATKAADEVIQASMRDLQRDIAESARMVKDNEDPSALNRMIAAKFNAYNTAIRLRAKLLYGSADAAAGGARIDTAPLADDARAFLKTMPDTLRARYPGEIRDLTRLAGEEAEAGAEAPDTTLSFGELHHLRSWFRYGIDYNDLTPDMKAGALKHFEKKINSLLHDAEAPPELREAAQLLDQADGFYKQNIPFLSDQMTQGTIDLLRSGAGVNASVIADMFFDPNRTAAMRKARGIIGENMWKSVQAAHLQKMLDSSKIVGTSQIDADKFAKLVEDEVHNGLLGTAYDDVTARRLEKIAADIRKLGGALPITAEPGDTISALMRKAEVAKVEAEKFAEIDPIKALAKEMKRLDTQYNGAVKAAAKKRKAEPLHFLYEDSMSALAVKAADRILGSQDLIMAAAQQFGRDSNEFKALQQVYAARFFQRPFGRTARIREELGGEKGMTEEVQALMFPGVTRRMMSELADNMEFLFSGGGSDVGGSMAAASRVLHPMQSIPIPQLSGVSSFVMGVPGVTTAARFMLGKYFALITDATSHPNFINWLAGRLNGDEASRMAARAVVRQRFALGGWTGRAVGQQVLGSPNPAPQQDQQ